MRTGKVKKFIFKLVGRSEPQSLREKEKGGRRDRSLHPPSLPENPGLTLCRVYIYRGTQKFYGKVGSGIINRE